MPGEFFNADFSSAAVLIAVALVVIAITRLSGFHHLLTAQAFAAGAIEQNAEIREEQYDNQHNQDAEQRALKEVLDLSA